MSRCFSCDVEVVSVQVETFHGFRRVERLNRQHMSNWYLFSNLKKKNDFCVSRPLQSGTETDYVRPIPAAGFSSGLVPLSSPPPSSASPSPQIFFFFLLLLEQHRQPPSAPPQQQQQQQPTTKKTFSETRSQRGDLERNPISPLICLCVSSSSSAASLNTVDDDFSTFYLFLLLKGSRNELCTSRINVLNSVLVCPFRKWRKTLSCGWNLIFMDDVSVGLYGRPAAMGAMQISLSRLWVAWAKRPVIADVVQQTIFSFLFSKCFIGFRPIV